MNLVELAIRIEALESRVAHQDRTIEEFNTVIADQWAQIDRLKRRMTMIDEQVSAIEQLARTSSREPRPPHY